MSVSGIGVLDADARESACSSPVLVSGVGVLDVAAWVGFGGGSGGCGCASAQSSNVTLERCTANGDGCPSL